MIDNFQFCTLQSKLKYGMKITLGLLFSFIVMALFGQQNQPFSNRISMADSVFLDHIPRLKLPDSYTGEKTLNLPASKDNSQTPYFRDIFEQDGWSCGQASTVGYNFTYEYCRARNLTADTSINLYPTHFVFNFFNDGFANEGVCYIHTLDMLKYAGTPNIFDYGDLSLGARHWMTGYEKYYRAMFNKVDNIYAIDVSDEEGLITLKHWLNDHMNGTEPGGLANFYTDLYGINTLQTGTPEAGKSVITSFGPYNGHSMTFIGWNDSIRWDYNNDGQFTNNLDINQDGIVNMKDWEIGAARIANSHGDDWADSGFCYVMYKVLAEEKPPDGIWNKTVHVFDVKENYEPVYTYKVVLKHTSRECIKVMAGISSDTTDLWPQHTLEFPMFNYQGGDHYMLGNDSLESDKTIEFGLDVTPLLSYVNPLVPSKFFILVHEHDPDNQHIGNLQYFALMDYQNGGLEIPSPSVNVGIKSNDYTVLSVVYAPDFEKPEITTNGLDPIIPGQPYSFLLDADGGAEPYSWQLKTDYMVNQSEESYPDIQGEVLISGNLNYGYAAKVLDFSFPFYGENVDTLYIYVDGFIKFNGKPYPLPYQLNDMILLKYDQMLAVFMNNGLKLSGTNNAVVYEGDETHASFRWKATLLQGNINYPVDFSCILYPDGSIDYYILSSEDESSLQRISGVSNGDGVNYTLARYSSSLPYETATKITLLPQHFLSSLTIDSTGLLHAPEVDDDIIYDVVVQVTDDNEISGTKSFRLAENILFDYIVNAGDNNRIDYGEEVTIDLEVTNIGVQVLNDIEINFNISDPYIAILNGSGFLPSADPGETILMEDVFTFQVDALIPDQYALHFLISFVFNNKTILGTMNMLAFAPDLLADMPVVLDENNGRLDPGETANVVFSIKNSGHAEAINVTSEIMINDPDVSILGPNIITYGNLAAGETKSDTLTIAVTTSCPQGHTVPVEIITTAEPEFITENNYSLLVGRYPLLVIDLDPQMLNGPVIVPLLEDMEVNYSYINYFPDNLGLYQNLMVFVGRKFFSHVITVAEGDSLAAFLTDGKSIYLEGGVTWLEDPQTTAHAMFNLDVQALSWTYHDSIVGVEGTFAHDMSFLYQANIGYYNHYLNPLNNAFILMQTSEFSHGCMVAFENSDYKTIGSNIDFCALTDNISPSTKKKFLTGILDFFEIEAVITSDPEILTGKEKAGIAVYPNPFNDQINLVISLDKGTSYSLTLIDLHGNKMADLAQNKQIDANNKDIHKYNFDYLPPGIYICTLQTETTFEMVKIVKF